MMSDFPRAILGNLIVHQKGFAFKSKDYQEVGIPVVRVSNFTDDSIDTSDLKFVSKENAQENRKVALKTNDVIIATVGSWPKNPASIVGKTICVPSKMNGALMNQNSVILRVKGECEIDQKYLFIALKTKLFSEYLVATAQGSANQASVTLSDIFSYEVEWPEPAIRKSIVSMIDSVNQKIQLNRQTNQTLQHIAQAIFKSWFVDFAPTRAKIIVKQKSGNELAQELAAQAVICGAITLHKLAELEEGLFGIEEDLHPLITKRFPNEGGVDLWQPKQLAAIAALFPNSLVDSELGKVPEGWGVKSLSEIIEVIGGGTPKRSDESYWGADVPWFSVKDAPSHSDIFVVDTIEKISELGMQKSSTKLLPVGTTIITARGTVGKLALVGTPMCMNQSCYGIRGLEGYGPYFNYFNLREAITTLQRNTHGAVFDTITKQTFESYSMPVAVGELVKKFEVIVTPILEKIEINNRGVITLSKLRDALLPKLLSGELTTTTTEKANHV